MSTRVVYRDRALTDKQIEQRLRGQEALQTALFFPCCTPMQAVPILNRCYELLIQLGDDLSS